MNLPMLGFLPRGRSRDGTPEDEKFTGKFFRQRRGVLTIVEGFEPFCDEGGVVGKGNTAKPYPEPSMALIPCNHR